MSYVYRPKVIHRSYSYGLSQQILIPEISKLLDCPGCRVMLRCHQLKIFDAFCNANYKGESEPLKPYIKQERGNIIKMTAAGLLSSQIKVLLKQEVMQQSGKRDPIPPFWNIQVGHMAYPGGTIYNEIITTSCVRKKMQGLYYVVKIQAFNNLKLCLIERNVEILWLKSGSFFFY